jgi:radical S-adenosyl methionine domain-containing protein 2
VENCNYRCKFCFAKYENSQFETIERSTKNIDRLLQKIYRYFIGRYSAVRLNIAGGEPTLSTNLDYIIKKAHSIGFIVSIITNGSKLTSDFIEKSLPYLSMFAISVDSLNSETNQKIGRISRHKTLGKSELLRTMQKIKASNPLVKIKINTVVNNHNYDEYMGDFIASIKPYKWKIFQALSMGTDEVYCSQEKYETFLENHKDSAEHISGESNDEMRESYIMIDPYGRFYQNGSKTYEYSQSLLVSSVEQAFLSTGFDRDKYEARYA